MPSITCHPLNDPENPWLYCPSFAAAIAFAILFGISSTGHVYQAFLYRKPFTIVLITAGVWETIGYICRIISIEDPLNSGIFTAQSLLILLAPLFINAFVYMVLGRAIHFFLSSDVPDTDKIFGVKARRITMIFVLFDITAFLIQAGGGIMTENTNPPAIQKTGLHVYMGGVGVQLFFIAIFTALAARFHQLVLWRKRQERELSSHQSFHVSPTSMLRLLYTIYAVLLLIVFRNVYRLVEFSAGVTSSITTHEWYSYVFDATPMFACLLILHIFHPGVTLQGPRSDFSLENKERKERKKQKKEAKRHRRTAEKYENRQKKNVDSVVSEV